MQKIGKAFGDMPGLAEMLGGAGGAGGGAAGARALAVGGAEEAEEGEEVESAFLAAAMEGDLAAVKKFIADGAAGAHHTPYVCLSFSMSFPEIGPDKYNLFSLAAGRWLSV